MLNSLKRYDVVLVDFGNDVIGSEQAGRRPSIIVQNDCGNLHSTSTIVIPVTSKIKNMYQPTHAIIKRDGRNGLNKDSMVLGECMRQISEQRIVKYLGKITNEKDQENIKKVYFANFEA